MIRERAVIERILRHIGEDAEEPAVREGARRGRRVGVREGRGRRGAREGGVRARAEARRFDSLSEAG